MPDEPIDAYRATPEDTQLNPYPPAPRDMPYQGISKGGLGLLSNAAAMADVEEVPRQRSQGAAFLLLVGRSALYGESGDRSCCTITWRTIPWRCWRFQPNSGGDPFPVFLTVQPQLQEARGGRVGSRKSYTYYTHKDLRVGNTVNVYGRGFLIHDADNFTKAWYIQNEGYSEADFPPVDVEEEELPIPQNAVPPYNGFGGLWTRCRTAWRSSPSPCAPTSTSR